MFRSRFSLLALFTCALTMLALSVKPVHAQVGPPSNPSPTPFSITDTQLDPFSAPGPTGPYQSKDEIDYVTSLSGSLIFIKYWQPGYVPTGSSDNGGGAYEAQEPIPTSDGTLHTYFNTNIWSTILSQWQATGIHPTGSACYYEAHLIGYTSEAPPGTGQAKVEAWGSMLFYTWLQPH